MTAAVVPAAESLEEEWGVRWPDGHVLRTYTAAALDREQAEEIAADARRLLHDARIVAVRRTVGPWEEPPA